MTKHNLFVFISSIFLLGLNHSCNNPEVSQRTQIDVSNIDLEIDLIRFDKALFSLDTNNIGPGIEKLYKDYPDFSKLYFGKQMTGFEKSNRDSFYTTVSNFLKDDNIKSIQRAIENSMGDLAPIKRDLTLAVKNLKHYFPEYTTPAFYTLNSEYGFQSFIFHEKDRDGIGIGLDMFLGLEHNYKEIDPRNASFSNYLVAFYNKDYIVRKTMAVIAQDIIGDRPGKRFIDQMIYNGKKLYLLEQLIPSAPDSVITEFTPTQLNWLNNNDMEMWSFFLEKNIMYETNFFEINKYLNPAPNSPGMPKEAPGNSASFMGLQIVKSFMKRNPDLNLQDLVAFRDSQKFLEMAKYKPKRR